MPWTLLSSTPSPPQGDDSWQYILMPDVQGLIAYGFRLLVPSGVPATLNTAGYWGVYQGVAGLGVLSATHVIPLAGRGGAQALRVIGGNDVNLVEVQLESLYLAYFKHKWLPQSSLELYGLI